jgi:hypothetical protein
MINYKLLDDSLRYYESNGFNRVESPWTVSQYVDNITKPKDRISFQLKHNDKCLVASGEQSFLYLYLKDFLPKGQFQTITPCFRFESFDFFHTKYFIKNELIKTDVVNDIELKKIIDIAFNFFSKYLPKSSLIISDELNGFDINYLGYNNTTGCEELIELGSYGIRECEFLKWIYGTGCAEPRTSKIIELYGLS